MLLTLGAAYTPVTAPFWRQRPWNVSFRARTLPWSLPPPLLRTLATLVRSSDLRCEHVYLPFQDSKIPLILFQGHSWCKHKCHPNKSNWCVNYQIVFITKSKMLFANTSICTISSSNTSAFLELTTEGQPDMFGGFSGVTHRPPSPIWRGRGDMGLKRGLSVSAGRGFATPLASSCLCSILAIFGGEIHRQASYWLRVELKIARRACLFLPHLNASKDQELTP